MLFYTGHPLFDVGVASVTVLAGKSEPGQVTEDDLRDVASFIKTEYQREPLKSFLGVAFTSNAWFNQPSFDKSPEKRHEYAERLLRGYDSAGDQKTDRRTERCVFTGQATSSRAFSDKLPPGRAYRQHVPLLTGERVINFFPSGDAGLPVSGIAVLCLQAMPLGCAKCGGKLLAVHSDNPQVTFKFAKQFLEDNRLALDLARQSGSRKMPESRSTAKTLLIETLLRIEQVRSDEAREDLDHPPCSVTAYHLTNSGQSNALDPRNPPLEIYHLPLEITAVLSRLQSPLYSNEWHEISRRAWRLTAKSKKTKGITSEEVEDKRPRLNYLYEDLFRLPDNAGNFIRTYLLRIPMRHTHQDDPRRSYSIRDEASLVSWKMAELFLGRVMGVERERIRELRELGDRLANYVNSENDRNFFQAFFGEMRYDWFRNALIKANFHHVKRGNPPFITFEPFITVFEEGVDASRPDWKLARDLVLIRMIEQLYHLGWLGKNTDILPGENTTEDQPSASE